MSSELKISDNQDEVQTDPVRTIKKLGEKKWEIIKAAAALFIKKGTVNTGVREIAEASGITVGTLYHYFKSKEDIIAAFLDYAVFSTNDFLHEADSMLAGMKPEDALKRALQLYIDFTSEAQDVVLFWHQETRNLSPDLRKRLMDNEYELLNVFEKIIERGMKEGLFKVQNSRLAAHNMIIMSDMWAFRRWDLGRRMTPDQFRQEQICFILQGLCNGSPTSANSKSREVQKK